jgi:outer membrane protein TolC
MFPRVPRFFTIRAATGVALSLLVLSAGVLTARAEEKAAAPAAAPVASHAGGKILTLDEAIHFALQRQPNILAARASLNNALVAREAANSPMSALVGPVIVVRRKQADLGVALLQATVDEAELSTVHAVTRCYLTVIYAQDQLNVAADFADRMKRLRDSTDKNLQAGAKHVKAADLDKIDTYALVAQSRRIEAEQGIGRAKAALREAMGAGADCCFDFATDTLDNYYKGVQNYCGLHGAQLSCCCCVDAAIGHRPALAAASLFADIAYLEIDAQSLIFCINAKTFAASADIHWMGVSNTEINGTYRPGDLGQEMPVFLIGHRSQRVSQAAQLADRAKIVREKIRGLIALEAEDACLRLAQEGGQVGLLRKAVASSEKSVEHGVSAFRNQQGGVDNWLESEAAAAQTKSQLNESLFKYAAALAALQKSTAGKLWSCLEKTAQVAPATEELKAPKEAKQE